ncbi:MAG: hypothetical protein WAU91_04430 [Desulfatitalea sp.]
MKLASNYIQPFDSTATEARSHPFGDVCAVITPNVAPISAAPPKGFAALGPTRVLRWAGGIVLAAAAVSFMCQGVYSFAPMTRHWIMLAICAVLWTMGLVTGTLLKETKGARTFLAFAAGCFPVLSSQLGAMLFSLFGQPPAGMPQPLVFSLFTSSKVAAIMALTMLIVVPASYFAFRILAPPRAALLTGLYTLANLCILMPVREGALVGWIIVAAAAMLYCADNAYLRTDFRMNNFEGRTARCMLTGPLWVMLGRSLFYTMGSGFHALMLALAGAYLSLHWGRIVQSRAARNLLQLAGNIGLAAGWLTFIIPVMATIPVGDGMALNIFLLPIAMGVGAHGFIGNGSSAANYRSAGATIALISVIGAQLLDPRAWVIMVGVIVSIGVMAVAALAGQKRLFFSGCAAVAVCLGHCALQTIGAHANFTWVVLSGIGILLLFSASLAEKGRDMFYRKAAALWGRMGS